MRITLDNTCLISLKNKEAGHNVICKLIDLHPTRIIACIPAIAASENLTGAKIRSDFSQFMQSLQDIGCERCELLNPIGYWDITYWDHAIYADEDMVSFERKIHNILFPHIHFDYSSVTNHSKWINAKCDVQAMWCHIHYCNDIFVTNDNNYRKPTKKPRLVALGAKEIMTPSECLLKLKSMI